MKKILVMGGTGAMGKYLVPLLTSEDYQVFVTSRSVRQSDMANLIYLTGNARDLPWIKTILQTFHFDVVFDFMNYSGQEFLDRYEILLRDCGHYFYFSSYRALGEDTVLTEDSPTKSDVLSVYPEYRIDRYGIKKAIGENLIRESGLINYTIIRPSMTFSSNRFQFFSGDNFDVLRAAKNVPTLLPEGAVNSITNLTYGKNVAKMLKILVDRPAAMGQTFNVVTKSMTWGEIGEAYKNVFGLSYKTVPNEKYLELIDLEDGRILDRFRSRNISNKKILTVLGLPNDDAFGTLEDNLREAWVESDQGRYKSSRASMGGMARFDEVCGSHISSDCLDERAKNEYMKSKKLFQQKVKVSDFWVSPNQPYWEVSESSNSGGGVVVERSDKPVTTNAWLNFRNYDFFRGFDKKSTYRLKLEIQTDCFFEIKFFLHFFGQSIFRLKTHEIKPGITRLDIPFRPEVNIYSDLAITGTEIRPGIRFEIFNVCVVS